ASVLSFVSCASGDSESLTSAASLASSPCEPLCVVTVVVGALSATVVMTAALPPAVAATAIPAIVAALALVLRMRSSLVRSIRKNLPKGAFPLGERAQLLIAARKRCITAVFGNAGRVGARRWWATVGAAV